MTTIVIRIAVLSAVMAIYMGFAFRGIEYDPLEAGPSLLAHFFAFIILTLIAVPLYKMKTHPDEATLGAFAFRFWAITAGIVSLAMIIYSSTDVASAGEFRDNLIVGTIIMLVMVVALNYALVIVLKNLLSKRRRAR
jgi:NhaP-type Na+/H+ or K+/H+ antiporter